MLQHTETFKSLDAVMVYHGMVSAESGLTITHVFTEKACRERQGLPSRLLSSPDTPPGDVFYLHSRLLERAAKMNEADRNTFPPLKQAVLSAQGEMSLILERV